MKGLHERQVSHAKANAYNNDNGVFTANQFIFLPESEIQRVGMASKWSTEISLGPKGTKITYLQDIII